MKKYIILLLSTFTFFSNAQTGLLDGTGYAPNFSVTDIYGTSHEIYDYLDSGYVMVLELMSVTCGHCISHAAGTENSYQTNGPNGSNTARFLGLEVNATTDSADIVSFATNYGASFPIANNVSPTSINYQLYYTPGYYVIYPDRSYTTICAAYCIDVTSSSAIEGLLNNAISAWPPINGCTDENAMNYDPNANNDDGSCNYTSYTIETNGMSFTPDTIVCDVGDTINFILGPSHNAVEVSDSTWISGGNTPLAGGFSYGFGAIGMFVPDDCHTFYYVCTPHAAFGMKGVIIAHHPPVFGCTDSTALNYDPLANHDDSSCIYSATCNSDPITGLFVDGIIDDRVTANFDNMNTYDASGNQICRVDQLRIKYREIGTSYWSQKNIGSPTGFDPVTGICNSTQKTDKIIYNLTAGTTYEWQMRVWYCDVGVTAWVNGPNFTTAGECPNVGNFTAYGANPTKATFTWDDSNGIFEFARIKVRVDSISNPQTSDWFNVGGVGVPYGTFTENKNGLTPGETYKGQARTWCDPNGGAYNALSWTAPPIVWTQPTNRIEGGSAIANLDVYPNPSRDVFNVTFTSEDVQNLEFRVVNVVGEVIYREDLQHFVGEYTKLIDLATYTKGVYFLEITTDNGVVNKKLILL